MAFSILAQIHKKWSDPLNAMDHWVIQCWISVAVSNSGARIIDFVQNCCEKQDNGEGFEIFSDRLLCRIHMRLPDCLRSMPCPSDELINTLEGISDDALRQCLRRIIFEKSQLFRGGAVP